MNRILLLLILVGFNRLSLAQTTKPPVYAYIPSWSTSAAEQRRIVMDKLDYGLVAFAKPNLENYHPKYPFLEINYSLQGSGAHIVADLHNHNKKAILSVGGGNVKGFYPLLNDDPNNMAIFAKSIYDYAIVDQGYDGVEIDWEEFSSKTNQVYKDENDAMYSLAVFLYYYFSTSSRDLELSFAGYGSNWYGRHYPITATFDHLSQDYRDIPLYKSIPASIRSLQFHELLTTFFIMAYDNTGEWSEPKDRGNHSSYGAALSSVAYWKGRGIHPSKLVLGVPFYGNGWCISPGAAPPCDKKGHKTLTLSSTEASYPLKEMGFIDVSNWNSGLKEMYFPTLEEQYLKAKYVKDNNLAGIGIWEVTQDYDTGNPADINAETALNAIDRGLKGLGPVPNIQYDKVYYPWGFENNEPANLYNLSKNRPSIMGARSPFPASKGNDGIANNHNFGELVYSSDEVGENWWRVDLEADYDLELLRIINRTSFSTYGDVSAFYELEGAEIYIADSDLANPTVFDASDPSMLKVATVTMVEKYTDFSLPAGTNGRYIYIKAAHMRPLIFLEFEAYGKNPPRPDLNPDLINLSLNKPSKVGANPIAPASNGNNGISDDDTDFVTTSNAAGENWWVVDLEDNYDLDLLQMYNQTDANGAGELAGAEVYIIADSDLNSIDDIPTLNSNILKVATLTNFAYQEIPLPKYTVGRYVYIKAVEGNQLNFHEFEVYGRTDNVVPNRYYGLSNLALSKSSKVGQSYIGSVPGFYGASNGNDGIRYSEATPSSIETWASPGSSSTLGNWWRVDLGDDYSIKYFRVYNTSFLDNEGLIGVGNSLSHAEIYVANSTLVDPDVFSPSDIKMTKVATLSADTSQSLYKSITLLESVVGQYVYIKAQNANFLKFTEFEVYGLDTPVVVHPNLAFGKTSLAGQPNSSYPASNATDGITNDETQQVQINSSANNWYRLDLEANYNVEYLRIYTETPGYLQGAKIYIADDTLINPDDFYPNNFYPTEMLEIATLTSAKNQKLTLKKNTFGRYIYIKGADDDQPLKFTELEVYGPDAPVVVHPNLALGRPGLLGNNYPGYIRNNYGTDGITSNTWKSATNNSFTHNWYHVNLEDNYNLEYFEIYGREGRTDLDKVKVYVADSPLADPNVFSTSGMTEITTLTADDFQVVYFPPNTSGQYVYLKADGSDFLSFVELEVYGADIPNISNLALGKSAIVGGADVQSALNGVDGIRKSDDPALVVETTADIKDNWWRVDLNANYNLKYFRIYNDSPYASAGDSKLYVANSYLENPDDFSTSRMTEIGIITQQNVQTIKFPENTVARYVYIKQVNPHLFKFREVEVYGENVPITVYDNIARHKPGLVGYPYVTEVTYPASSATDEITISGGSRGQVVTNREGNWYRLDLENNYGLEYFKVYTHDPNKSDLDGAKVYVANSTLANPNDFSASDMTEVATLVGSVVQTIDFPENTIGQYVYIKARDNAHLQFLELEVYGLPSPIYSNLALNKNTLLGSTAGNSAKYRASNGTDGITNNNNKIVLSRQTNWWRVDLNEDYNLEYFKIYNRTSFASRLNNASVYVADSDLADPNSFSASKMTKVATLNSRQVQTVNFPENTIGRYIYIKATGTQYLNFREFEVYGNDIPAHSTFNLALDKPGLVGSPYVTQFPYPASSGTDGIYITGSRGQVVANPDGNWYRVNLEDNYDLEYLKIYAHYPNRSLLEGARVYVATNYLEDPNEFSAIDMTEVGTLVGDVVQTINFPKNTIGQYVYIKARNNTHLKFLEFEVYGENTPIYLSPPPINLALHKDALLGSGVGNDVRYRASNGTDGVTDNNNRIVLSRKTNWWRVDLNADYNLEYFRIYNRTSFAGRLNNAKVYVADGNLANPDEFSASKMTKVATLKSDQVQTINFPENTTGRYIYIKARSTQYLNFREVEVYGGIVPISTSSIASHRASAIDKAVVLVPVLDDRLEETLELVVYPNPVHDILNVKFTSDFMGTATIQLFNVSSLNLAIEQKVESSSLVNEVASMDISSLKTGAYILSVTYSDGSIYKSRVIKE